MECWLDPNRDDQPRLTMRKIGNQLKYQYLEMLPRRQTFNVRTNLRIAVDPSLDALLRMSEEVLRHRKKHHRILFHYNGHGVPKPNEKGEIYLFDKSYSKHLVVSYSTLYELYKPPIIYIFDCANAGHIINLHKKLISEESEGEGEDEDDVVDNEKEKLYEHSNISHEKKNFIETVILGPSEVEEPFPQLEGFPLDLFTSCLTTPLRVAMIWWTKKNLLVDISEDLVSKIPGLVNDSSTPLGQLKLVLSTICDLIAWRNLGGVKFSRLFRQDQFLCFIMQNFLLADRVLRSSGFTPVSYPALPSTNNDPLWTVWDHTLDQFFQQFRSGVIEIDFFDIHMEHFASSLDNGDPTPSLPVLYYVINNFISKRLEAVRLLLKYCARGKLAVQNILCCGFLPQFMNIIKRFRTRSIEIVIPVVGIIEHIYLYDQTIVKEFSENLVDEWCWDLLETRKCPTEIKKSLCFIIEGILMHNFKKDTNRVREKRELSKQELKESLNRRHKIDMIKLIENQLTMFRTKTMADSSGSDSELSESVVNNEQKMDKFRRDRIKKNFSKKLRTEINPSEFIREKVSKKKREIDARRYRCWLLVLLRVILESNEETKRKAQANNLTELLINHCLGEDPEVRVASIYSLSSLVIRRTSPNPKVQENTKETMILIFQHLFDLARDGHTAVKLQVVKLLGQLSDCVIGEGKKEIGISVGRRSNGSSPISGLSTERVFEIISNTSKSKNVKNRLSIKRMMVRSTSDSETEKSSLRDKKNDIRSSPHSPPVDHELFKEKGEEEEEEIEEEVKKEKILEVIKEKFLVPANRKKGIFSRGLTSSLRSVERRKRKSSGRISSEENNKEEKKLIHPPKISQISMSLRGFSRPGRPGPGPMKKTKLSIESKRRLERNKAIKKNGDFNRLKSFGVLLEALKILSTDVSTDVCRSAQRLARKIEGERFSKGVESDYRSELIKSHKEKLKSNLLPIRLERIRKKRREERKTGRMFRDFVLKGSFNQSSIRDFEISKRHNNNPKEISNFETTYKFTRMEFHPNLPILFVLNRFWGFSFYEYSEDGNVSIPNKKNKSIGSLVLKSTTDFRISDDGKLIIAGFMNGNVGVYGDYLIQTNGKYSFQRKSNSGYRAFDNPAAFTKVAHSSLHQFFLAGSNIEPVIKIFDMAKEREYSKIPSSTYVNGGLSSLEVEQTSESFGNIFAAGYDCGHIALFDRRMRTVLCHLREHDRKIIRVLFPNFMQKYTNQLISGCSEGIVKVWDPRMRTSVKTIQATKKQVNMTDFAIHHTIPVLLCGTSKQHFNLHGLAFDQKIASVGYHQSGLLSKRIGNINCVSFHRKEYFFAIGCGSDPKTVTIYR